jgi:hypothetical protein
MHFPLPKYPHTPETLIDINKSYKPSDNTKLYTLVNGIKLICEQVKNPPTVGIDAENKETIVEIDVGINVENKETTYAQKYRQKGEGWTET